MTTDPATRCPECAAADCRRSKWRSSSERRAHPNSHPYRCCDCSHRFYLRDRIAVRPRAAVTASLAAFAIVVVGTVSLLLLNFGEPPAPEAVADPSHIDAYTQRAANEGDADAQFRLARTLLADPYPDRKSAKEAVRWLQAAAGNEHTGAMVELGKLYRSGIGVLQDFKQAAKWFETAAGIGDPEGMRELGRLYRDGIGFRRDPVQAYVWFNRAAAGLNVEAARDRDDVARGLTEDQLKEAQHESARHESAQADAVESPSAAADPEGDPAPVVEVSVQDERTTIAED